MNSQYLRAGDLRLDLRAPAVTRGRQRLALPGLSYRLLKVLAERWPDTVSRRELVLAVWGDVVVSDDALRQRVRLLRRLLGSSHYVASVKGVGYRLGVPVDTCDSPPRRLRYGIAASLFVLAVASILVIGRAEPGETFAHGIKHAIRH